MILALFESGTPTNLWEGYWIEIICLAVVFGALGGVIGVFRDFDIPALLRGEKLYVQSPRQLFAALAVSGLSGMGGSIAVLSILILDGKFKQAPDDAVRLGVCSLGTVAGFIGFTVLNSLARGLAQRIDRQAERVTEMQREIQLNTEQLRDQSIESAIALGFATANQAASGIGHDDALPTAIGRLKPAHDKQPTNRTVAIILGRLYRWSNDYQKAIDVLTASIDARNKAGILPDTDTAALYFNRACYHALLAKRDDGQDHVRQAIADLRISVNLDPANAQELDDPDLVLLKGDERFQEWLKQRGQLPAEEKKKTDESDKNAKKGNKPPPDNEADSPRQP